MRHHRVWLLAVVLSLSIGMLAAPASAWEFRMDGTFTWEYDYRSSLGSTGFFGPHDFDAGASQAAGSLNAWLGAQAGSDTMVAGSDASWNVIYMSTNMEVRVNPAIRVRGNYYIGAWNVPGGTAYAGNIPSNPLLDTVGLPVAAQYYNYTAPGVQRSFSPGYWNTLWMTAQLPWGTMSLGKRASIFGTGLAWNGIDNRSSESCSLVADYGPLRIGLSFYPSREGSEGYYNRFGDKNNRRIFDGAIPTVTYRNGPLDVGLLLNFVERHNGPERFIRTPTQKATQSIRDRRDFYGGTYMKYNNGRFFFNAEFDWYDRLDRVYQHSGAGVNQLLNNNRYVQDYRLMAELGVLCGPAKVAIMSSWLAGNDRRRGVLNGINQGVLTGQFGGATVASGADNRWNQASLGNTGLYRPYSYLMVYSYGLGAYINNDTNNGYVDDAMTYAARLDYAVAANLNLYGSFFWADRVGNGYGWGYLALDPRADNAATPGSGRVTGAYRGSGQAGIAPNIPDNNLGWEVDAGFDWKLLEGLLLNTTFAYWQPGRWFNYACISKTNLGWNTPNTGNQFGTYIDRKIDPIFGLELKVVTEF